MTDKIIAKNVQFNAEQINKVADRLKPRHVTLLHATLQNIPYQQLAEELKLPIGTIKSATNRARLAIAKELAEGQSRD